MPYLVERSFSSNPKMEYQVFLCIFQKNSAIATLGLNDMKNFFFGKIGKKVCPVGCLSLAKLSWDSQLGKLFSLPSQRNFPISFKLKTAIAEFFWRIQRKTWYSILGVDAMPLSLKDLLLNHQKGLKNTNKNVKTSMK